MIYESSVKVIGDLKENIKELKKGINDGSLNVTEEKYNELQDKLDKYMYHTRTMKSKLNMLEYRFDVFKTSDRSIPLESWRDELDNLNKEQASIVRNSFNKSSSIYSELRKIKETRDGSNS